jgi:hypothetical protein
MTERPIASIREFATVSMESGKAEPDNVRIRNPILRDIYKGGVFTLIDLLLAGDPTAVVGVIKFDNDTVQLASSIVEYGQQDPVRVSAEGKLVEGEGRLVALALSYGIHQMEYDNFLAALKEGHVSVAEEDLEKFAEELYEDLASDTETVNVEEVSGTTEDLTAINVELNLRRKAINRIDLGYYCNYLESVREFSPVQIARIIYPGKNIVDSLKEVETVQTLTKMDRKLQRELRDGLITEKSALKKHNGSPDAPPDDDKVTFVCSAQALYNDVKIAQNGEKFEGIYSYLPKDLIDESPEYALKLLGAFITTKGEKKKASSEKAKVKARNKARAKRDAKEKEESVGAENLAAATA